jgi:hypothetical protein
MSSAPVAFLMFILFQILSTFSIVTLLNSKSGTCSLLFNISLILEWFEESYTASIQTNYRPVSVLPIFSKNFEKVYEIQLSEYFDKIFNPFVCAFRRGHGCN